MLPADYYGWVRHGVQIYTGWGLILGVAAKWTTWASLHLFALSLVTLMSSSNSGHLLCKLCSNVFVLFDRTKHPEHPDMCSRCISTIGKSLPEKMALLVCAI